MCLSYFLACNHNAAKSFNECEPGTRVFPNPTTRVAIHNEGFALSHLLQDPQKPLLWFFTGMLEPADSEGGALGKTFQCLLADQFKRLREGDRFWHENAPNRRKNTDKTAFTRCQLQEIRKVTLAKIICDNAENIPSIPRRVLQQSKTFVDCNKLPEMNLDVFTPDFRCPRQGRYVCNYFWFESNFTWIRFELWLTVIDCFVFRQSFGWRPRPWGWR